MHVVAENYKQTDRHTHTHTRDNYRNPRCACTPRVIGTDLALASAILHVHYSLQYYHKQSDKRGVKVYVCTYIHVGARHG